MKYIDAEKLIERLEEMKQAEYENCGGVNAKTGALQEVQELIDSLQQEPRFPQYDNIVEKVFGAGNLESFEYREAEMLVALAKEELLRSLQQEQPEVDLKKEIERTYYDGSVTDTSDMDHVDYENIARHFYELGLNARKKELPEIELNKFTEKIKTFQGRYKPPKSFSIKGAMAFMARMFYQYPNVARQWYDSLPKATMD